MRYSLTRFANNTDEIIFPGVGPYEIPEIMPEKYEPCEKWIPFSDANRCTVPERAGVHFFIDDYRFERVWQNWKRYGEQLKRFHSVMTPDFSMFTDYPIALQLWNHYRKQFIGAYLQTLGCKVYPTICWSDEKSYAFCFDGVPVGGCVCVSSVGTQKHHESKRLFSMGYSAMLERLQPETVIFYGDIPKECKGNIVHILAFQEKFKVVKNGDIS